VRFASRLALEQCLEQAGLRFVAQPFQAAVSQDFYPARRAKTHPTAVRNTTSDDAHPSRRKGSKCTQADWKVGDTAGSKAGLESLRYEAKG
jgi:hypothetical protein